MCISLEVKNIMTTETKSDTMFCYSKKGENHIKVAKFYTCYPNIYPNCREYVIYNSGVDLVNAMNILICNHFNSKLPESHLSCHVKKFGVGKIDGKEVITSYVSKLLRYRRCTAMVVVQISDRGVRFLLYMYDEIIHNGGGFGTSCNFTIDEAKKIIKETFEDMKNDKDDYHGKNELLKIEYDENLCFL